MNEMELSAIIIVGQTASCDVIYLCRNNAILNLTGEKSRVPLLHLSEGQSVVKWRDGKIAAINNGYVLFKWIDALTVVVMTSALHPC